MENYVDKSTNFGKAEMYLAFNKKTDIEKYLKIYDKDHSIYTEVLAVQVEHNGKSLFKFIATTEIGKVKLLNNNFIFKAKLIYFNNDSFNDFEIVLSSKYLFEILDNTERKLHFDIDMFKEQPIPENEFNKILTDIHVELESLLETNLDKPLVYVKTDKDLIRSAHLIYHKYRTSYEDNKNLAEQLNINLKNELVDNSIYSKFRLFSLAYKAKIKNDNCFKNYGDNNSKPEFKNYLINETENTRFLFYLKPLQETKADLTIEYNTDYKEQLNSFKNYLPSEFYNNKFYWKLLTDYIIKNNYDIIDWLNHSSKMINKSYTSEEISLFLETMETFEAKNYNIIKMIKNKYSIDFNGLNVIDQNRLNWLRSITKLETDDILSVLENNKDEDKIKLNEFIYKPKTDTIISTQENRWYYYYYWLLEQKLVETQKTDFITIEKIEDLKTKFEKNQLNSITGVRANWGSGKTYHLLNTIISINLDKTFLLITENNTLNRETKRSLNEKFETLDIVSHLDKCCNYRDANIAICSLESIHKINKNFDFLILDEYQSVVQQFNSSTVKHKPTTSKKFYELIYNSIFTIALDANLQPRTTSLLSSIKNIKPNLYFCKTNNFENYNLNFYQDKDCWINQLITDLTNDKKVILASAYKKNIYELVNVINKSIPNKKIVIITSEPKIEYHNYEIEPLLRKDQVLTNIENFLLEIKPDLFIYSPTITTGINIRSGLFDVCYGFNQARNSVLYDKFIQMLFRARNLNDKTINILTQNPNTFKPNSYFDTLMLKNNKLYELYKQVKIGNYNKNIIEDVYQYIDNLNLAEIKWSEKTNLQSMLDLFYDNGFNINFIHAKAKAVKPDTECKKSITEQIYETEYKFNKNWIKELDETDVSKRNKFYLLINTSSLNAKIEAETVSINNLKEDFNNKRFKTNEHINFDINLNHTDYNQLFNSITKVKQLEMVEPRRLFYSNDFVNYYPNQELLISSDYKVVVNTNLKIENARVKLDFNLDIVFKDNRPNDRLYKRIMKDIYPEKSIYEILIQPSLDYINSLLKHKTNLELLNCIISDKDFYDKEDGCMTKRDKLIAQKKLIIEFFDLLDLPLPNPHLLINTNELFNKLQQPEKLNKFKQAFLLDDANINEKPNLTDLNSLLRNLKVFKTKYVRNTYRYFDDENYLYDYETSRNSTNVLFYNKYHSHFGLQKDYTKSYLIETRKVVNGGNNKYYIMNGKMKLPRYRNKFYKNWFLDKNGSWIKKKRNDVKVVYTTRELPEYVIDKMERQELVEYYKTQVLMEFLKMKHLIYNKVKYDIYCSDLEKEYYEN